MSVSPHDDLNLWLIIFLAHERACKYTCRSPNSWSQFQSVQPVYGPRACSCYPSAICFPNTSSWGRIISNTGQLVYSWARDSSFKSPRIDDGAVSAMHTITHFFCLIGLPRPRPARPRYERSTTTEWNVWLINTLINDSIRAGNLTEPPCLTSSSSLSCFLPYLRRFVGFGVSSCCPS